MGSGNGGFTTGLLVGGIIGTAIGILLAPKPGSETRSELFERSEYIRDKAEELSAAVKDVLGPTIDQLSERIAPTLGVAKDKVSPVMEVVREKVTPLVEQVNARFADATDSLTDKPEQPRDRNSDNSA